MFLELKKAYHADVKIKVELLTPVQEAEEFQTKFENPETKYKLNVKNMGQTLYTKNPTDADSFNFKTGQSFDIHITQSIYNKLKPFNQNETVLICFVTQNSGNNFWLVEATNPDPIQVNEKEINIDYEKQKIKNRLQNSNTISTTDDRIAWAVAINNATRLVADINTDMDKKIKLIEDSTARIYEIVKSLDTYLINQTDEEKNETNKQEEKDPWE